MTSPLEEAWALKYLELKRDTLREISMLIGVSPTTIRAKAQLSGAMKTKVKRIAMIPS
jgi:hypothetical protein